MAAHLVELASQTCSTMYEVWRMVTLHDQLTEEMQRLCLRLNDELIFSPQKYGEQVFVHIEVPSTQQFYRIGFSEYVFLSQFDGQTTTATALAVTAQSQGAGALNEQKGREVIDWLLDNGLAGFVGADTGIDAGLVRNRKKPWYTRVNPFWIKLPIGNPSGILESALPLCRWVFHPLMLAALCMVILSGLFASIVYWDRLFEGFQIWNTSNWIWLLLSWAGLKAIHEFAHGITCRHFGGQVREAGLIFILLAPLAYVNVTSSWRFSSSRKRIAVALAGMFVELLVASICVFILLNTDSPVLHDVLINTVVMAGLTTLLFNANPLMRFDGYFVLADMLRIPNLYESGFKSFRRDVSWLFLGKSSSASCYEMKRRRRVTSLYGWMASFWKLVICAGMSITASTMFGGFGILLAMFGIVCWFGKPTYELVKRLSIQFRMHPQSVIRAAVIGGTLAIGLMACWFWVPNPFSVRAPCLVKYNDAAQVRAGASGFVDEVWVEEGSYVEANERLLSIKNVELDGEIKELQAKLHFEMTRERIALDQSDVAEAQVAVRQQAAIRNSLSLRQRELEQLTVKAPCAGRVVAKQMAALQGRYIEKGAVILLVSDESAKEVVVSLPINEMHSARNLVGTQIPIELGSRRKLNATVCRLAPRATAEILNESLTTIQGGPLAVRQKDDPKAATSDSEFEYLQPRLNVVVALKPSVSRQLWAGERGRAVVASSAAPTVGKWAYLSVRDWIRNQLKVAASVAGGGT